MTEQLTVEPGMRVQVELISRSKTREKLKIVLVADEQADFDKGFLSASTPLAKTLLGHTAGETLDYKHGDIVQLKIVSVEAGDALAQADTAEQRGETLRRARDKAELSNLVNFALTFDSKWGDYDPEQIVKQSRGRREKERGRNQRNQNQNRRRHVNLDFDLYLNDPKEFFIFDAQTYDPFDENALGMPGLDYLVAHITGFWLRAPRVTTRVFLPAEKHTPQTEARLRRAVYMWCDDLLVSNRRERAEFLINNTIFLGIALLILIINWILQDEIVVPTRVYDPTLSGVISYGADVLVWVALWAPVSGFLLEWFPLYRRNQIYQSLREMKLSVQTTTKQGASSE